MVTVTTVKSSAVALAHYSETVCSKLTELLDHDTYASLFNNLKDKFQSKKLLPRLVGRS